MMAEDQLGLINGWLSHMKQELREERISYSELAEIEEVYNIIKEQ